MRFPKRLECIGEYITPTDIVADVGADHGLLEQYLLNKFSEQKILAIENKIGPFSILKNNLKNLKNVTCILSDGIDNIDDSINTLVIAGMGGINIVNILYKNIDKLNSINKIIVDPHRDINLVRQKITDLNFKINDEKLIKEDGKFYNIICFVKSNKKVIYSDEEIMFGFKLFNDELWPEYKEYLILQNNKKIKALKHLKNKIDEINELKMMNERLENYGKNETI